MPDTPDIKTLILQNARKRFEAEGFSRVSVDDLAADLGMSKKTFYKHVASKDALLDEVIGDILDEVGSNVRTLLSGEGTFIERLDRWMGFLAQQISHLSKLLILDLQRRRPDVWARIQKFRKERILEFMGKIIAEGIREGHIRSNVHPELVVSAFIGTIEAVINPEILAEQSYSAKDAIRGIMDLFFLGMLTEEASRDLRTRQSTSSQH